MGERITRTVMYCGAAVLSMCALAVGGGAAAATDTGTVMDGTSFLDLMPAADGALWGLEYGPLGAAIDRIGTGRLLTHVSSPAGWMLRQHLDPITLPDGSVGMFLPNAGSGQDAADATHALVRFDRDTGAVSQVTALPPAAAQSSGFTIAPDGAIWFARSCEDRLGRIAPKSGRISYVRLPRLGCGPRRTVRRERGAGLAFDAKGALWLVNLCMGRIDRVSLTLHVRQWRAPLISCPQPGAFDLPAAIPATIVPDPNGGIAYASSAIGAGSGRVQDGRRQRFPSYGAGVFTADGTLWRLTPRGIERRSPDGEMSTFGMARRLTWLSELVTTPAGGVAAMRASYWRSYGGDSHNPPTPVYLDPEIVVLTHDGSESSIPLPDGGTDASAQLSSARLARAPDGSYAIGQGRVGLGGYPYLPRLLRILPDDLAPPPSSRASVRMVLGHVGRVVWLQLSCAADPARFCVGSVTLKGASIASTSTPFALAGQTRGAVPVRLGAATARRLRSGVLQTTAVITSDDAPTTRRALKLSH